ncbi:uncharacterized protein LOC103162310 [Cricetulus griseus]|uniref:Uncharacterized protein LOC103162310 n=1 Tax=Cricetulus griseus TaxID=10029 RepID=A0A9J7GV73_CRIGR|nr:uncharacterized protein LOC103162310 [Cricetulus griseus]XP_035310651.1 uncharacterized protein LOC103162310 [Cricetulus griseus]
MSETKVSGIWELPILFFIEGGKLCMGLHSSDIFSVASLAISCDIPTSHMQLFFLHVGGQDTFTLMDLGRMFQFPAHVVMGNRPHTFCDPHHWFLSAHEENICGNRDHYGQLVGGDLDYLTKHPMMHRKAFLKPSIHELPLCADR